MSLYGLEIEKSKGSEQWFLGKHTFPTKKVAEEYADAFENRTKIVKLKEVEKLNDTV